MKLLEPASCSHFGHGAFKVVCLVLSLVLSLVVVVVVVQVGFSSASKVLSHRQRQVGPLICAYSY